VKSLIFVIVLLLGTVSISRAADPCDADKEKFCSKIKVGNSRMTKCFQTNESKLAPECKKSRDLLKEKLKQIKEVCQDDFDRYCRDKDVARGEVKKCLMKNRPKLSKVCRREMNSEKKTKKARKKQKRLRQQQQQPKVKNAKNGTD
jgi:hypothetical protein